MDTYQEAKEYLAKGNRGNKWYISLARVFALLPEGDERIIFAQKYVGSTKFGKDFIKQYKNLLPKLSYHWIDLCGFFDECVK